MLFNILFTLSLIVLNSDALYTTLGSPCEKACNSPQNGTYWTDLVCADGDYTSTSKGQLVVQCMGCQSTSLYTNGSKSDEYWYMYLPHAAADNCAPDCSPLKSVLNVLWINKDPFLPQYNYCTSNSSAYTTYASKCAKCLQAQKGTVIVGNMVETMLNACQNKPLAINGEFVKSTRDIFNSTIIPLADDTSTNSTSAASTSPSSPSTTITATGTAVSSDGSTGKGGELSSGAAAGIGVGVGVLIVALAVVTVLVWRRRKRSQSVQTPDFPQKPELAGSYYDPGKDFKKQSNTFPTREMAADMPQKKFQTPQMVEADSRSVRIRPELAELPEHPVR